MTSKEIEEIPAVERSERHWLKEIAYQLALQNERKIDTPQPRKRPN